MLLQLAGDTANVADELALLLDASSVRDTTSSGSQARKRVRVAWTIKALANQSKVPGLVKKLETYRNGLVLRVVVSLKLNANLHKAREDARFGTLETLTRRIAEDLLANTSYFTTGLGRLQEGQETESELARIRHEETIAAIATLQGTNATNLSSELTDRSLVDLAKIQHDVLDLLWFRFMTDRQEEISAPYKATFGWSHAARTGGGGTGSNHLASWLVQGTGIYWVNGKAGSGKSTFMKHMATDPKLRRCYRSGPVKTPVSCTPSSSSGRPAPGFKSRRRVYYGLSSTRALAATPSSSRSSSLLTPVNSQGVPYWPASHRSRNSRRPSRYS